MVKVRKLLRCLLASFVYYSGLYGVILKINAKRRKCLTILTFHSVVQQFPDEYVLRTLSISKEYFEEIIRFLLTKYKIITFEEFITLIKNDQTKCSNMAILTFDDGYRNVYKNAFPVLVKYNIPATIFLPTSFVDNHKAFWWDRLYTVLKNFDRSIKIEELDRNISNEQIKEYLACILSQECRNREKFINTLISDLQSYNNQFIEELASDLSLILSKHDPLTVEEQILSWDEVKEMDCNNVSFGSHTRNHSFLTSVPPQEREEEILDSKNDIEKKLKNPVFSFSYPGGKLSTEIKNIVMKSGYKCACTTYQGCNTLNTDPFLLKRINIWQGVVAGLWGKFSRSLLALELIRY